MGNFLFRQAGGDWQSPSIAEYANEAELESLIESHPELLPGVSTGALVCRQFPTSSGPIDLLIVNADTGAITIVECKLARNPEVRRKVFGQIVDYAASLRLQAFAEFHSKWLGAGGKPLTDLTADVEPLAEVVSRNLVEARFTLVLAVDGINEQLKQMVLYINEKTEDSTRIALIELGRHKLGEMEVLTPETFGYESAKPDLDATQSRPAWPQQAFEDWLEENEPDSLGGFRALLLELGAAGFSWGGTRAQTPSGCVNVKTRSRTRYPILFHTFGPATVEIRFQDFKHEDFVREMLQLFDGTDLIDQPAIESAGYAVKPKIDLAKCADPDVRTLFLMLCQLVARRGS